MSLALLEELAWPYFSGEVSTSGAGVPLAAPVFAFRPAYPAVLADGPEWQVIVTRPPEMTVVETIVAEVDAEVPRTFDESHTEQANELGKFSFSTFDVDGFDIQPGDLVAFYDRGLCIGGGVIRSDADTLLSVQSETKPQTLWSGTRPIGVLEEAPIFPSRGMGSLALDRIWGWFGISYVPVGWLNATVVARYGTGRYYSEPDVIPDFHDTTANWVWASRRAGNPPLDEWSPEGECLFRQSATLSGTGVDGLPISGGVTEVEIEGAGDAFGEFWFEGESLMSTNFTNANPDEVARKRVSVVPGSTVLLAVAATNDPDPEGDQVQNPGGAIWSVWWIDPATGNRGGVLMHSDSSALVLEYPPRRPGVTPGEVLLEVLEEVQFFGWLPWVTPTFTRDVDSNGRPWAEVGEIGTKVGYSLWKLLSQLVAVYVDTDLTPATNEWHVWSKGTRGGTRAVTLAGPTSGPGTGNIDRHVRTRTHSRATDVLSYSKFGWQLYSRYTSGRRIAATVGHGALPSQDAVERYAEADLDEYYQDRVEHDVDLLPPDDASKPYWAYGIGDHLIIDGDSEPVVQIDWKRDRQGRIHWEADDE